MDITGDDAGLGARHERPGGEAAVLMEPRCLGSGELMVSWVPPSMTDRKSIVKKFGFGWKGVAGWGRWPAVFATDWLVGAGGFWALFLNGGTGDIGYSH